MRALGGVGVWPRRYRQRAIISAYEQIINFFAYGASRTAGGQRFGAQNMIVTHEREKLIQAINYFARNTRKLGKTKLFKLLYFLDFEHFKVTGRSVTGLSYNAWPKGPVPVSLFNEIDAPGDDLKAVVDFEQISVKNDGTMLSVRSRVAFSDANFSQRELRLLKSLADEYRDADSESMVEATHLENLPWNKIYKEQGRRQAEIPYDLAIRSDERVLVTRVAEERAELLDRLK